MREISCNFVHGPVINLLGANYTERWSSFFFFFFFWFPRTWVVYWLNSLIRSHSSCTVTMVWVHHFLFCSVYNGHAWIVFYTLGSHELSIAASLVLVKRRRARLDERDGFRCVHFPRHAVLLITFKKRRAATDRFWVGKNSDWKIKNKKRKFVK